MEKLVPKPPDRLARGSDLLPVLLRRHLHELFVMPARVVLLPRVQRRPRSAEQRLSVVGTDRQGGPVGLERALGLPLEQVARAELEMRLGVLRILRDGFLEA